MQDLALEEPETPLKRITHPVEAALIALDQREQIVEILEQHRLDSLPVVDVRQQAYGCGSLWQPVQGHRSRSDIRHAEDGR